MDERPQPAAPGVALGGEDEAPAPVEAAYGFGFRVEGYATTPDGLEVRLVDGRSATPTLDVSVAYTEPGDQHAAETLIDRWYHEHTRLVYRPGAGRARLGPATGPGTVVTQRPGPGPRRGPGRR